MDTVKNIAVLPGDGIGPEVTREAVKILEAVSARFGRKFSFSMYDFGGVAYDRHGTPLPDSTLEACRKADAVLLGAIGGPGYNRLPLKLRPESGLLALRRELELFANLRPVTYYSSLKDASPLREPVARGTDLMIVRELTGGMYYGEKGRSDDGTAAYDRCDYTVEEIDRVSRLAFRLAAARNNRVSLVDKANVLETSRLWRETVERISGDFPEVTLDFLLVDHAAMKLITQPSAFDVILTENLFGDILSDEASVITGSLGMMPSASLGRSVALYEPVHGSWPEAAGKGKANPVGAILSAALMLEWSFGWKEEAEFIRHGVRTVLRQAAGTEDLRFASCVSTREMGDLIASAIREEVPAGV